MWCDELYTVWVSRLPADSFFTALSSWGHPPLYYLLGRVWFVISSSDAWSRSISFVAGVALIFLIFVVGKELFSRQVGLWAAGLASLSPLLVSYSRDATVYSWLTTLTLLSFYLLTRSIMKGGWQNWGLFTIVAAIAIFSHLFSFLLLLAFAGAYFILRERDKKSFAPFMASELILAAAFVAAWLISRNADGLINVKFPLKIILVKLVLIPYVMLGGGFNDFGAGIGGTIVRYGAGRPRFLAALLFILVVVPLFGIFWRRKALRRTFLSRRAIALVFFTAVLSVIPVILHNVLDIPDQPSQRFYLWAAPTFLLLVALGIASLSTRGKMIAGTILIAGFSTMTVWGVFFYHPLDFKTPLTFVSTKYQKSDLLYCPVYDISVLATGHYLPQDTKMAGLLLPAKQSPGEYYFLPDDNDLFAYTAENPKTIDAKYLTSGDDLKRRARNSLKGTDRLWVVVFYDDNGNEYCPGCDVLSSVLAGGWQEQTWSFDSGKVYLYTRLPART